LELLCLHCQCKSVLPLSVQINFEVYRMKTCVVLPTYNEAKNIGVITRRLRTIVPELGILVVDDNSPDGTADRVRELQREIPELKLLVRMQNKGFSQSYRDGFRHVLSTPDLTHVVTMDADLSHSPEDLRNMLTNGDDYDVVVGSRYVSGGRTEGWELWRVLLSALANWYCRAITGLPLRDCTSGFTLIRLDCLRLLSLDNLNMSGYAFLMELKHLLWQQGARFSEVPITFRNRAEGESKLSGHIIAEGVLAPWRLRGAKTPPASVSSSEAGSVR
jgi:dolichol-phosphate mannosyltransferase